MSRVPCAGPGCDVSAPSELVARLLSSRRHPGNGGWICSDECARASDDNHSLDGGSPEWRAMERARAATTKPAGLAVVSASARPAVQKEEPPPVPHEPSPDDEEIDALLADHLGSTRPMNLRGATRWEAHQTFFRACLRDRETVAARIARLGRDRVARELRGEGAPGEEQPSAPPAPAPVMVGRDMRGDPIVQRPPAPEPTFRPR